MVVPAPVADGARRAPLCIDDPRDRSLEPFVLQRPVRGIVERALNPAGPTGRDGRGQHLAQAPAGAAQRVPLHVHAVWHSILHA